MTALTPPPAIIPGPGAAGFIITRLAPCLPIILCGTVPLIVGIYTIFRLAMSFPFCIADITSLDFPSPIPM